MKITKTRGGKNGNAKQTVARAGARGSRNVTCRYWTANASNVPRTSIQDTHRWPSYPSCFEICRRKRGGDMAVFEEKREREWEGAESKPDLTRPRR